MSNFASSAWRWQKVLLSPACSDDDFDDVLDDDGDDNVLDDDDGDDHDPQHALMMNPVSAKKMVMLLQEAYPARPKVGLRKDLGHFLK